MDDPISLETKIRVLVQKEYKDRQIVIESIHIDWDEVNGGFAIREVAINAKVL